MKPCRCGVRSVAGLQLPLLGAVLVVMALLAGCSSNEGPPNPVGTDSAARPASTAIKPTTSVAPPAPRQDGSIDVPAWQAALRIMDGDGDGRVSVVEHAAAAARMFSTMDRNGDGQVTVDEMAATRSTLPDARGDTERALRRVDTNADGRLDTSEHAAATRVEFDRVDANHDGYMDASELQAADSPSR